MGDQGTLQISESAGRASIYREQSAPLWDKWLDRNYLNAPTEATVPSLNEAVLDVRETVAPPKYELPVNFNDPYHKPHLENFFNSIRGKDTLNCPAEVGYETAVAVLKVNEAVEKKSLIEYGSNEFTL